MNNLIRRREFILSGGAAMVPSLLWPAAAFAQQPAMPVIGTLYPVSAAASQVRMTGFHRGLDEAGFVEGRNLGIEYRWADGQPDRLPAMAADLVRRKVAAILAGGSAVATRTAMAATKTIPIVFTTASDPVAAGYVASLNRPGGNVTGVTALGGELGPKRVELMRELIPAASRIAFLGNPNNPATWASDTRDAPEAARRLGLEIIILRGGTATDIDKAFAAAVQQGAGALLVGSDAFFGNQRKQILDLAMRHRLPASYSNREFVEDGGLLSYGASRFDGWRQAGLYVGRILKGEKPGDLPVMQPTKFELVVNLKTAKSIGLTIPESFLLRADEVIE